MYKIATYTICKNEKNYIDDWYNSVKLADEVYILDTGSTDGTLERLKEIEKNDPHFHLYEKHYDIFSFGDAWNTIIEKIPENIDIICRLDLDQYIVNHYWPIELRIFLMANKVDSSKPMFALHYMYEKNFRRIEQHISISTRHIRWAGDVHERPYFPNFPMYNARKFEFPIYIFHNQKYPSTSGTKIKGCQKKYDFYKEIAINQYQKNPTVFNFIHYLIAVPSLKDNFSEIIDYLTNRYAFNPEDMLKTYGIDYKPQIIDLMILLLGICIANKSLQNFFEHEEIDPITKDNKNYPYFAKISDTLVSHILGYNPDNEAEFGIFDMKEEIERFSNDYNRNLKKLSEVIKYY